MAQVELQILVNIWKLWAQEGAPSYLWKSVHNPSMCEAIVSTHMSHFKAELNKCVRANRHTYKFEYN